MTESWKALGLATLALVQQMDVRSVYSARESETVASEIVVSNVKYKYGTYLPFMWWVNPHSVDKVVSHCSHCHPSSSCCVPTLSPPIAGPGGEVEGETRRVRE